MQWVEGKGDGASARVLLVDNHAPCAQALARLLQWRWGLPVDGTLLIADTDPLEGILRELEGRIRSHDVLCVDAQLTYAECPDPAEFGGIRLAMHIRLSDPLQTLTLLPIIFISVEPPELFIRQAPDLIFAFSPGCGFVRLPERLSDLGRLLQNTPLSLRDPTRLREALRPFVVFTDADERQRAHAYLNRAGVGRFLKEFVPAGVIPEDHPVIREYERMRVRELWLKKMEWVRRVEETPPASGPDDEEWNQCIRGLSGYRFVLIDDEHRYGWSLGLYAGLTGHLPEGDVAGRLRCIDSFAEAYAWISRCYREMEGILRQWAEADRRRTETKRHYEEALGRKRDAEAALQVAGRELQRTEDEYTRLLQRWQQSMQTLKELFGQAAEHMADLYTSGETFSHGVYLKLEQQMRDLMREWSVYGDIHGRLEEAEQARDRARREVERIERSFRESDEESRRLMRELQDHERNLRSLEARLREVLPGHLVFLDLRLERADEARPVDEISGIRLLGDIKRWFPVIPVIVLTASERVLTYAKAMALGADGYWIKGIQDGRRLREEVRRCAERILLIEPWLKLLCLERKSEWHCYEWDGNRLRPRTLDPQAEDRELILELLKEALGILAQAAGRKEVPGSGEPWNTVVVKVGLVQEVRYRGLFGPSMHGRGLNLSGILTKDELDLRNLRNEVVHYGKDASCQEAIRFFGLTLNWLLHLRL